MAENHDIPSCPLLFIADKETWRRPPVRDFTDLVIIFALLGFDRRRTVVNMASISEFTGISRATATRRMRHLVEHDIVAGRKSSTGTLVSLTPRGAALAEDLVVRMGCPHGACRQ